MLLLRNIGCHSFLNAMFPLSKRCVVLFCFTGKVGYRFGSERRKNNEKKKSEIVPVIISNHDYAYACHECTSCPNNLQQ